jgi:hypothetical protein
MHGMLEKQKTKKEEKIKNRVIVISTQVLHSLGEAERSGEII